MGTYTPNLNLYKPDASDDFGNFRQEFNNNMDKLDNGGGGGSGGHTILDPSGSALPQEDDLQFTGAVSVSDDNVNGRTVVNISGGTVYGAFLDPDRVVYSGFTFDSNTQTWTATEDVILTGNMLPPDGSTAYFVQIDGVQVFAGYSTLENPFVYVKQGQVVTYRGKSGSTMKAYGIKQGTNGIFAPVIYSDNERVIGVWRDNKPLYQRTFIKTLAGSPDVNGDSFLVANGITGIDTLVKIDGTIKQYNNYAFFGYSGIAVQNIGWNYSFHLNPSEQLVVWTSGNSQCYSNLAGGLAVCTIQYTKTSDVAGSGNWNTDGVPTVHYSTSEQVIGTWYNGKPIYQKVLTPSVNVGSNTITHGIANFEECVNIRGMCKYNGTSEHLPLPYVSANIAYVIALGNVSPTTFLVDVASGFSSIENCKVIIQYTKTTD